MTDYFLKFTDQQQALEVMQDFTYTDEDGVVLMTGGHQWAIWVLPDVPGVEGYHVNLRLIDQTIDVSNLEPYSVNPKNPVCVWA